MTNRTRDAPSKPEGSNRQSDTGEAKMDKKRILEDLHTVSLAINDLAECLTAEDSTKAKKEAPAKPDDKKPEEPKPEPEKEKTHTYEDVRGILARLARTAKRAKAKAIVEKHGSSVLSSYRDKPDILNTIYKEAEELENAN